MTAIKDSCAALKALTACLISLNGNWSMAGCSGFVQYTMAGVIFTIGFSNPSVGNNKVGIGFSGKGVWDEMTSNDYKTQDFTFPLSQFVVQCSCICSGGETNEIQINLQSNELPKEDPMFNRRQPPLPNIYNQNQSPPPPQMHYHNYQPPPPY